VLEFKRAYANSVCDIFLPISSNHFGFAVVAARTAAAAGGGGGGGGGDGAGAGFGLQAGSCNDCSNITCCFFIILSLSLRCFCN